MVNLLIFLWPVPLNAWLSLELSFQTCIYLSVTELRSAFIHLYPKRLWSPSYNSGVMLGAGDIP